MSDYVLDRLKMKDMLNI